MGTIDAKTSEQMSRFWSTADDVEKELMGLGFTPFPQPSTIIPAVSVEILTTVNDREYTEKFSEVHSWYSYGLMHLARIRSRLLQVRNNIKHLEAAIRVTKEMEAREAKEKKPTVQGMKDLLQLEADLVQLQQQEQRAIQAERYMDAYVTVLHERTKLFSRQVEIRRQEKEQSRVEDGLPLRGYRPPRS